MKTTTVTKLDPAYKVHHSSISSEHEKPLYFDEQGRQIPYIEEVVPYKPEYDFETSNISHWYFRTESKLYRDIHKEVATFRSRNAFTKYAQALWFVTFDKYVGRFFS